MNKTERLIYGLGHIAYAVAMADGEVQARERRNLEYIVKRGTHDLHVDLSSLETIFLLLDQDELDMETSYEWGMEEINKGRADLTDIMREEFLGIAKEVAAAYPPITGDERKLLDRFAADLGAESQAR
jgi:tellurite resistance protein